MQMKASTTERMVFAAAFGGKGTVHYCCTSFFACSAELDQTDGGDEQEEQNGFGLRGAAGVDVLPVERVVDVQRQHLSRLDG